MINFDIYLVDPYVDYIPAPKEKKSETKSKIEELKKLQKDQVLKSLAPLKLTPTDSKDLKLSFRVKESDVEEFKRILLKEQFVEVIDEEYTKSF